MNKIKTSYIYKLSAMIIAVGISFALAHSAFALPTGFSTETVASGLYLPTAAEYAPDGRIFVAEKGGTVKIVKDGSVLPTPFYQVANVNTYGDRGLLGLTLDPGFSTNGYVYLLYSYENTPGINNEGPKTGQLIRVTADGDVATPGSELVLLGSVTGNATTPSCTQYATGTDCIGSDNSSHSVADLQFGADGTLYVSIGDGADFNGVDPLALRSQSLDSLNGKVLRINPDGTAPVDNPYYDGNPNSNRSKVWHYGFRNPFRFDLHPVSDEVYVGDVGWYSFEEINYGTPGSNFGWPCEEGATSTPGYNCSALNGTSPLYTYPHDTDTAGSITGGVFYKGTSNYPTDYVNTLFFGDFAQNWIKILADDGHTDHAHVSDFMSNPGGPVDFFLDNSGNVNYIAIYAGSIERIIYSDENIAPTASIEATPPSGLSPLLVSFDGTSSFDLDSIIASYMWDFGDGATSSGATTTHTYYSEGTFLVTLTVTDTEGATSTDTVTITSGNEAPTASIVNPPNESTYIAGQYIPLVGTGTDPEDGTLPENAFSWRIILHHNVHIHIIDEFTGSNPTILAPGHGDPSDDVYIEAELTVTDSAGLTDTTSINLREVATSTAQPFVDSTIVAPIQPLVSQPLEIITEVGVTGTSAPVLVDIELFDSNGTQLAQTFYDNQLMTPGVISPFSLNWTPTATGTYRVAVGLIKPSWNGLYSWINNALTFDVLNELPPSPTSTATTTLLGAGLKFDGLNDYINTEQWDIEENEGFTLEALFEAESTDQDVHLMSKEWTTPGESLWVLGIKHNELSSDTLFFSLRTNGVLTTIEGGTVTPGEKIHASAVFDGSSMKIYKNGAEVASTLKTGPLTTNPTGNVWLGDNPALPTQNPFNGVVDEMRVWNLPRTQANIAENSNVELDLNLEQYGLIKYWRMNEGFGQDVIDWSNSGHHGILGSTDIADENDPVYLGEGFALPGGTFTPTHSALTLSATSTSLNTPITLTESITNTGDGAGYMIVNLEIFDSENNQVYQTYFDGEGFLPGETRDFEVEWTPTATGTYRVAVGLVELYWSGVYEWVNEAGTITVTNEDTGTPPVDLGPFGLTHVETVITPSTIASTGSTLITTTVLNTGEAGLGLVDIEIYEGGTKIDQIFYENEPFDAEEQRDFSWEWTPPYEGEFGVTVGLFGSSWSEFLEWNSGIGMITVTNTPVSTTTPPATSTPGLLIYEEDNLESGWNSWSWDTDITTNSLEESFAGSTSLAVTYSGVWGGLYLRHDPLSTEDFSNVSFEIHGGSAGDQKLQLFALDASGSVITPVQVDAYTPINAGSWSTVIIPLADLGVTEGASITGFILQGYSGALEETFYLDNIQLTQ